MRARTLLSAGAIAAMLSVLFFNGQHRGGAVAHAAAAPPEEGFAPLPPPDVVPAEPRRAPVRKPGMGKAPLVDSAATSSVVAKPGTYVPRGFAPNFREMIVHDLAQIIDARVPELSAEKRRRTAAIQNAFWDEHGPTVDAFNSGAITQLEFAERTHVAMDHWREQFSALYTDDEYRRIFDLGKGDDVYLAMFHSADEQPGMPVKAIENDPAHQPDLTQMKPPTAPPPTEPKAAVAKPGAPPPPSVPPPAK